MGQRSVFWLLLVTLGCLLTVAPSANARELTSGKASVFAPGGTGDAYGRGPGPGGDWTDPDDPFELDRVLVDDAATKPSTTTWQSKWLNRFVLQLVWMSRVIR